MWQVKMAQSDFWQISVTKKLASSSHSLKTSTCALFSKVYAWKKGQNNLVFKSLLKKLGRFGDNKKNQT
jgi:hypothetical protein